MYETTEKITTRFTPEQRAWLEAICDERREMGGKPSQCKISVLIHEALEAHFSLPGTATKRSRELVNVTA